MKGDGESSIGGHGEQLPQQGIMTLKEHGWTRTPGRARKRGGGSRRKHLNIIRPEPPGINNRANKELTENKGFKCGSKGKRATFVEGKGGGHH